MPLMAVVCKVSEATWQANQLSCRYDDMVYAHVMLPEEVEQEGRKALVPLTRSNSYLLTRH